MKNTSIYVPSRNDILSLQTESYETFRNNDNYSVNSDMSGGKNKPSPGDVFHQDAIEYLKSEMKLPEIEARAYKSIAYRKVKEMKPEANNLERAQLMLELVKSKNFIKENKDKLAEVVKILEAIDMEKKAREVNTEEKTRRSRRASRKSSRKASRKSSRKASRKSSRKASRKSSRKSSRKASRKGSRKSQNGGNINNYSETSVNNFTESNVNVPYYNEYMAEKAKYLHAKQSLEGGVYLEAEWTGKKPNYPNPTTPENDLRDFLARIEEDILPNLASKGKLENIGGFFLSSFVKRVNQKYSNIINF
jgi:hypothetical protein